MRLKADEVEEHLRRRGLAALYFVTGDEPLRRTEIVAAIRDAALARPRPFSRNATRGFLIAVSPPLHFLYTVHTQVNLEFSIEHSARDRWDLPDVATVIQRLHGEEVLMLLDSLRKSAGHNGAGRSKLSAVGDARQSPIALSLIGESPAFLIIRRLLHRMAQCDATVLIQGETGTGKEVAARAIHYLGSRRNNAFIPVNCGAIPDALFENEFFGHVRGAYTDAREAYGGVIGQAEGGTLFLDEVEALSKRGQVALLRFLQDHTYRPVGCNVVKSADVRIIAAANMNLSDMVRNGEYREDLFFRLQILCLDLPPLRMRGRDVVLLAEEFIERFSRQYGIRKKKLDPAALQCLCQCHWRGNIRELENLIHREFLLSEGPVLSVAAPNGAETAQAPVADTDACLTDLPFREAKEPAIGTFEKSYLIELLSRSDGNISQAARVSGKERSRLGRLIRKHRLSPSNFRKDI